MPKKNAEPPTPIETTRPAWQRAILAPFNFFNRLIDRVIGTLLLWRLRKWKKALEEGEVTVAPAEGVYGFCCDPFNPTALQKILALKQRDQAKGFVVLIADARQLAQLCPPMPIDMHQKISEIWGGVTLEGPAVSLVLPALKNLPTELTGKWGTVVVRLPNNPFMLLYLKMWGKPLVSTSLNVTGEPPATRKNQLPKNLVRLTARKPLTGSVSRIYDIEAQKWLR